jgi:penicillin-binding protein 1C
VIRSRQRARGIVFLLVTAALSLALWASWRGFRRACGSPAAALGDDAWTRATEVRARDGRLLGERASREGLRGRAIPLDAVSPRLVSATQVSEDHDFLRHDGIDRSAVVRALFTNLLHRRVVSGGSTISQQLVKRLDHHGRPRPRDLATKLVEAARAQNLESEVDKRTILAAYLVRLDYGRGLAGPEAAAQGYFGVGARDVSLAQAALLAVLPRAPSALDPYRHRDRAVMRQRVLLARMHARGVVSREDLERALAEPLVFRERRSLPRLLAPHVVLAAAHAQDPRGTETRVNTTLDYDLQADVEALARLHAARLREKGAAEVAVVVVDVATGDVLAHVGSADVVARAGAHPWVDAARARRQPGSTLKPFVYARAFEAGVSPMAMLADVPTSVGAGPAAYAPENFDGAFLGPISAREALAGSLNVPVVRLAHDLGAHEVVETLRAAGLPLPGGAARHGLSVALGSGEVTPLELAEAYVTLARGGEHVALRSRAEDPPAAPSRVLDAASVAAVADALADPFARIRGLRVRGPFELPFPTAVKTGTSSSYRDAWTAGFTRERVVVVWTGNADGAPTNRLTGAAGAGPLFTDVMLRAMRDVAPRAALFEEELLEAAEVCPLSGLRAGPACDDHVRRRFPRGRAPEGVCHVHARARRRVAPEGEPAFRCDPDGDARIVALPAPFDAWLAARPLGAPGADAHGLPWFSAAHVPGCDGASASASALGEAPRIVLLSPRDGARLEADDRRADAVDVEVETFGLPRATRLEVAVDGHVVTALDAPYRGRVPVTRGDHLVEVRPADGRVAARLGRAEIRVR